ncbi:hypothetical protein [Oxynema aestuarii]|uniref:hypothetical protein n=1 Tax=Oxynema aestuarii TaxID=2874213 RepID=UPI001B3032DE|nr:hypothetical protein [Oxynema aestuarii]
MANGRSERLLGSQQPSAQVWRAISPAVLPCVRCLLARIERSLQRLQAQCS